MLLGPENSIFGMKRFSNEVTTGNGKQTESSCKVAEAWSSLNSSKLYNFIILTFQQFLNNFVSSAHVFFIHLEENQKTTQ